ncbi:MAG TPA: BON domain-containing protein [Gemmatimonadaceae bacterium]|nr:BON domain-containing protein [Gemmatimonadaceae bacterium]
MYSDTALQKNVIDELAWDPALTASEIGVAAKGGVVTLSGKVRNYSQKYAAEKAARRVSGVKALADELEVHLLPENKRYDTDIAHAVLNGFIWNVAVPEDRIQVDVENGWVTLRGKVEWDFQRRAAEASVRSLTGVRGVSNLIAVTPSVSVSDVKGKIESALKRYAEIDAKHVQVSASDGTVTLRGTVRSWTERNDAERAAWAAPGVRQVDDLLTVGVL